MFQREEDTFRRWLMAEMMPSVLAAGHDEMSPPRFRHEHRLSVKHRRFLYLQSRVDIMGLTRNGTFDDIETRCEAFQETSLVISQDHLPNAVSQSNSAGIFKSTSWQFDGFCSSSGIRSVIHLEYLASGKERPSPCTHT